jgi:hypothetical protein
MTRPIQGRIDRQFDAGAWRRESYAPSPRPSAEMRLGMGGVDRLADDNST